MAGLGTARTPSQPYGRRLSSRVRSLKPEANWRLLKRRSRRRASELPALSCCLWRNLGERAPTWPFPALALCVSFTPGTQSQGLTAIVTAPFRFLEGEGGEDTAKILQTDIAEAVDIASAAKVSLRRKSSREAT